MNTPQPSTNQEGIFRAMIRYENAKRYFWSLPFEASPEKDRALDEYMEASDLYYKLRESR